MLVAPLHGRADRGAFLALPRRIRAQITSSTRHSPWVEPLRFDQRRFLDPSHPFYAGGEAAEAAFFLARADDGRVLGRVAAIDNHLHNQHARALTDSSSPEGFFGFFESVDDASVARALLAAVEDWLRARGCGVMLGPASPSHNYEYGLLVEGFDAPHRFMLAHNPAYYPSLMDACGLEKARDLYAFTFDLQDPSALAVIEREAERVEAIWRRRFGSIQVRSVDRSRWSAEVRLAVDLVNRSLQENWGFSPMTEGELKVTADTLRFVVDPEMVLFAEHEGRPIGVALALPDLNETLARVRWRFSYLELVELLLRARFYRFESARVVALGVARDYPLVGLGPVLFLELFRRFRKRGIRFVDASWILEDNEVMLRSTRRFQGVEDRRYRIYQKVL